MDFDPQVCASMSAIDWFDQCGKEPAEAIPLQFQQLSSAHAAIDSALGDNWQDAGTAAQGELTGYLARTDYNTYGTSWNQLGEIIEEHIKKNVMQRVDEGLRRIRADSLSNVVLLDLTRIALRATYAKRFRRVPSFYQQLLVVYELGHLPCGWIGDLDFWPEGKLILY